MWAFFCLSGSSLICSTQWFRVTCGPSPHRHEGAAGLGHSQSVRGTGVSRATASPPSLPQSHSSPFIALSHSPFIAAVSQQLFVSGISWSQLLVLEPRDPIWALANLAFPQTPKQPLTPGISMKMGPCVSSNPHLAKLCLPVGLFLPKTFDTSC